MYINKKVKITHQNPPPPFRKAKQSFPQKRLKYNPNIPLRRKTRRLEKVNRAFIE